MRTIVSIFISQEYMNGRTDGFAELSFGCEEALDRSSTSCCSFNKSTVLTVANTWDEHLAHIALDAGLSPSKFLELVEVIPTPARSAHDMLYKAVHTYLMELYKNANKDLPSLNARLLFGSVEYASSTGNTQSSPLKYTLLEIRAQRDNSLRDP